MGSATTMPLGSLKPPELSLYFGQSSLATATKIAVLSCCCVMAALLGRTCTAAKGKSFPLINTVIRIDSNKLQWKLLCLNAMISCHSYHSTPSLRRKKTRAQQEAISDYVYNQKPLVKLPVLNVWKRMTVKDMAEVSNRSVKDVLKAISYIDTSPYDSQTVIEDPQVIFHAVKRLGGRYKLVSPPGSEEIKDDKSIDAVRRPPADPSELIKRHPVVTVMGHVDHGKTTLLDTLRHTSVVDSEFGGITQHIGAFNVNLDSGERITFLDTPGHAAFSSMRARGAHVTDIVVLVVAADDGVMEQTVQSIRMAREAEVPIIVAVNKIDKPDADIERTERMLAEQGIQVESLGGEIPSVNISALKGTNLKELIETIAALAEVRDLKGDPKGLVEGVVLEVSTQVGRGKLATVLIQRGTLRKGAVLVSGIAWAKVRAMFDHGGAPVSEAKLSEAVQIIGWRELPFAGDEILEVQDEHRASVIIRHRQGQQAKTKALDALEIIEERRVAHDEVYKEQLAARRASGKRTKIKGPRKKETEDDDGIPRVNVVIKSDVLGSAEAILDAFETYSDNKRCHLDVIHYGIGAVAESDVELAEAFDAIVYTFNVDTPRKIQDVAMKMGVSIRPHKIIYKLIDDVKSEIGKKLAPEMKEEILGKANVLEQIEINEKRKPVNVAGCRCTDGMLKKGEMYRILRDNETIFEGKLASMRHLKDERDTVKSGIECGLRFVDPNVKVQLGDTVICFRTYEVPSTVQWDPGF
ncbi:translation initiation factor IF-2, mitochondrial [Fopius arisanus]|uniref:Translation initiation factor IF-2, mitochondrial n=2 Tax=Fopius arisanus TaxID=64838 RepID=A0A9R1T2V7_9HYME|nr:PREDICTED: translation initiation factor IF-2, mitochondrial [Fopius arisanus]